MRVQICRGVSLRDSSRYKWWLTYTSNGLIHKLNEVCNVGELEGSEPVALVNLDLVVDDHKEAEEQVCCNQRS